MTTARYYVGDVFDVMATLPDGSVDLILTSPPFLALRSYLPADHPDKAREIGSEANPAEFVDTLLRLTAEWRRLLAPHGTIAVELGDTYSGSAGSMYDARPERVHTSYAKRQHLTTDKRAGNYWPLAKSLALVPELYRIALAYGANPLTGQPSPAGQWRVRNVVRWVRPNPPVGALGDKFRPATSDMVIACTSAKRWFDLDAVRSPVLHPDAAERNAARGGPTFGTKGPNNDRGDLGAGNFAAHPAGAPPLDWWEIPPGGYQGSHYAVFPAELCVRPIKAMCPAEVCRVCGEPRRRIVETFYTDSRGREVAGRQDFGRGGLGPNRNENRASAIVSTLGWTDCGHGDYRRGVVLDPFGGSGTTGVVATGHGREAWLIDLDERNADLARERIGMFVDIVDTRRGAA
jgi:hypothetical protein